MGKGDKRTFKGKIVNGTFGNTRRKKPSRAKGNQENKAKEKGKSDK